jgi:hypothetical protein
VEVSLTPEMPWGGVAEDVPKPEMPQGGGAPEILLQLLSSSDILLQKPKACQIPPSFSFSKAKGKYICPTNKVFFDQSNKKGRGSNSKDLTGGHFKTLSPRTVTNLGGALRACLVLGVCVVVFVDLLLN